MTDMDFPRDAASYVLYEAERGSNIGSAQDWPELRALLDELLEGDRERLPLVAVVAYDKAGERIGNWSAASVLVA
jgi:hypothetical protein